MKIGKLTSINYSQLKVKISSEIKGSSVNLQGEIYYFGNIGSYLKIKNAIDEIVICEVVSIFDLDIHKDDLSFDIESNRELLLKPIGNIKERRFALGVGIFPALYSDVSIVTREDMDIILNIKGSEVSKKNEELQIHSSFHLGVSKNLINYPIDINIDNFFNIHSAILGNSGSGKSNTIAYIIQEIHKKEDYSAIGSKILIFDVNGEYKQAFKSNDNISVKCYKPNIGKSADGYEPFYLPHFLLSIEEWSAFLMATEVTQQPFWSKVLQESYRFYKIGNTSDKEQKKFINYLKYKIKILILGALKQADSDTARITTAASMLSSMLDIITELNIQKNIKKELKKEISILKNACSVSYGLNGDVLAGKVKDFSKNINNTKVKEVENEKIKNGEYFDYKFLKIAVDLVLLEEEVRGNKQVRGFVATMLTRLDYFLENPDCEFMRDSTNLTNTDKFLESLWGEKDDNKIQLVIIDTSELSPDILETLTSVTTRILFDKRKGLKGDERIKNPIHLILDEAHRYIKKDYKYTLQENVFEKIAREGRKFAFYLLVSSQRPSELSETVLSQCANFIIHRIQNENDMRYIQAILPYFSEDFTNKIKQSVPGEALVFGNCVSMPLHLKIEQSSPEPNSKNCKISEEWFKKIK
jgi:ABC-type dipeptide/oligopeptide/nickel transport system ATPase component